MAVEVERLVVTLEANLVKYRTDLAQSQAITNAKLAAMEQRYSRFAVNLKNSTASVGAGIGSMLGGIGAALGTAAVIEYANAWTRITRAVDASGSVFGIALKPATELNKLANDARVDLDAYAKLYIRTSAAIRDYGFEAGTAETVTSTLAKALKLGGAAASEQASVLLQFSQALQKGKLDSDEFRAVMENAGVVQELLASRLGVTKGEIIKLAAAGKLQIKDLVGAMVDGSAQVDRIFRQMPQTVDEAFAVLRNNFVEFIGQADQATGTSQALAASIVTISQNLDKVAVIAGAVLSSAALRMAAFAAATVSAANPLTLIAATIGGLATAYGVFGDEVKISGDNVVSLKDAFAAFLDIAGGYGAETLANLGNVFEATREKAASLGEAALEQTGNLATSAIDLDEKFGGYGAAIVSAFISANRQLAETLGITTAINGALDAGNAIAARAREIALAKGIEQNKLGGRLGDYLSGKITNPRPQSGATADPNAKKTDFEREAAQIRKKTEALKADVATIGQSTFAQDKARASAELTFAAIETARREGRKYAGELKSEIDQLSTAYASANAQAAFLAKLQSERENTSALQDQIDLIGLQGQELERAKIQQQLLNEAKRTGAKMTPELLAEIDAIAQQNSALSQQLSILNDVREQSADALKGFISDMREGKSASEALANSLDKIADKLLDMAVDGLVESALGGLSGGSGGGGGLLGSLFGGGYSGSVTPFANGGVASQGMRRFAGGGVSDRAAIFGEAGPEAAVPLPDGRRIPVDLRMPSMPNAVAVQSSAPVVNFAPVFNVHGGEQGASAIKSDVMPQLKKMVQEQIVETFNRNARFARSGI